MTGATINRELELARTAFNRAIKNKKATHNPFAGFDKFTEVETHPLLIHERAGTALRGNQTALPTTNHPTYMKLY